MNDKPEYIVFQIKMKRYVCNGGCDGSGEISHKFRNKKYVKVCRTCDGEGYLLKPVKSEVSFDYVLSEKLKELNLIK